MRTARYGLALWLALAATTIRSQDDSVSDLIPAGAINSVVAYRPTVVIVTSL